MQAGPARQGGGGRPQSSARVEFKKGDDNKLHCKHCDKAVSDKTTRLKSHLGK